MAIAGSVDEHDRFCLDNGMIRPWLLRPRVVTPVALSVDEVWAENNRKKCHSGRLTTKRWGIHSSALEKSGVPNGRLTCGSGGWGVCRDASRGVHSSLTIGYDDVSK